MDLGKSDFTSAVFGEDILSEFGVAVVWSCPVMLSPWHNSTVSRGVVLG
jgi:hypothetical protein